MSLTAQIASHLRHVYNGGNWTTVNYKDAITGLTWQQATTSVHGFNSIAVLVYHTHYYVVEVTKVLEGQPLTASDKFSFACPPIQSQPDWEALLEQVFASAETFATLIEQLPEDRLGEDFVDAKYGTWYRNLSGIIEHLHYHLGQVTLIRKLLEQQG